MTILTRPEILSLGKLGRVVQKLVNFNPGLNNIQVTTSFQKALIKECSDFPRRKLYNLKITALIRLLGWKLGHGLITCIHGLVLIGFTVVWLA